MKPENILLNDEMHILIADFGSAKILKKEPEINTTTGKSYLSNKTLQTEPHYKRTNKMAHVLCEGKSQSDMSFFFIAPAYSKVRYRGSTFLPSVPSSVRSSVRPQFMSRCFTL